jgi:4'-phosphopantetheinyl transferase
MPLLHFFSIRPHGIWGTWENETDEKALLNALPLCQDRSELETIRHPQRRSEWLNVRLLVADLLEKLGEKPQNIWKDENRKPWLADSPLHLSISHKEKYCTAILSVLPVGIDIELISEKMQAILPRVFAPEELERNLSTEEMAIYWCGKEAVYKWYGKRGLDFSKDILIRKKTLYEAILYPWEPIVLPLSVFMHDRHAIVFCQKG